jgi:hypothetical protein
MEDINGPAERAQKSNIDRTSVAVRSGSWLTVHPL